MRSEDASERPTSEGGPERVLVEAPAGGAPELQWKGKRALTSLAPCRARRVEVHGPRAAGEAPRALYLGDNLRVVGHLLERWRGAIDLVYLDPPFQSRANYGKRIRLRGVDGPGPVVFEAHQYGDLWGTDDYLQFMYERLIALRTLLSPRGSLFLQCDWHQAGNLRVVLDEVFGPGAFRNEVVWHYYNKIQGNVGRFAANHDTLLYYAKGPGAPFHKLQEPREVPVRQIKRVWDKKTQSLVNAKNADGHIDYVDSTHRTVDDVWRLSMLQPADKKEPIAYPTQKPEALLERIIAATTSPGDVVLDPFMGSGTTQVVAQKLGRRFLGIDTNPAAVATTTRRLLGLAGDSARMGSVPKIKNGLGLEVAAGELPGFEVWAVDDARGSDESPAPGAPVAAEPHAPALVLRRDGDTLEIVDLRPAPLLAKLAAAGHAPDDWRALVDLVLVDSDWDGATFTATLVDLPREGTRVAGRYTLPSGARHVRVKVTDLLGDAWEGSCPP